MEARFEERTRELSKPAILQLRPLPDWDQLPLEADFEMLRYFAASDKPAFLQEHGPRIRAISTSGTIGASRDIIMACPRLELVAVYGVGYDAVDLPTCTSRGIHVTNTPDVLTEDVADLGVGMLLAISRGIVPAEAWLRSGSWSAQGPFPLQTRVSGKRAGILGLGRIGQATATRLTGFGMQIGYCDLAPCPDAGNWTYYPDPVALAQNSDVLFVTLAATEASNNIVSRAVLAALGPAGILVNISRASNVDEEALLEALETNAIRAAALDVFKGEPALNPRFLTLENVLLQPHHASATVETRKAMGRLMRDNLVAHFAGLPLPSPVQT